MANIESSQLDEVIAQLKSLNFSHDVLLDAIDDNTKLAAKNLLISTQVEGQRVDNGGQLLAVVNSMRRMVFDISRSSKELLEFFTSNDMQQEENRKDLLAAIRGQGKKEETTKKITKTSGKDNDSGLAGILAFAAGLIGGTVVGFISKSVELFSAYLKDAKWLKTIGNYVLKINENIVSMFGRVYEAVSVWLKENKFIQFIVNKLSLIGETITSIIAKASEIFTSITKSIIGGLEESKLVQFISGKLTTIGKILTSFGQFIGFIADLTVSYLDVTIFQPLVGKLQQIGKAWSAFTKTLNSAYETLSGLFKAVESTSGVIGESTSGISKFFSGFTKFFSSIGETFGMFIKGFNAGIKFGEGIASVFGSILKALGPLMEAIAFPLLIITGIVGAVTGFIKGFKEDGIIGGIKGAIVGIFDALIGGLLDMIKGAVSWIASALGFDGIAKALDSFSFNDLFKKLVDWVFDDVGRLLMFVAGIPGIAINGIIEMVKGFINGYKADGIIGAIKGALTGLYTGTIGVIGDTLKSVVSWIANLLGFTNFSKWLDSFSIKDLLSKGIDAIFALPTKIWNWITSMFSWDNIGKLFEDFSLSSLFTDFYGTILDTIKGAVSWMAGLVGFDMLSKYLDSFSFTDIFKTVFDAVDKAIDGVIDWIMNIPALISELAGQMGEMISGAASGVGNLAEGFAKSVLKDVLPDPAASTSMLNPMHWVAKAIPDSVYEYAGITNKTNKDGEAVSPTGTSDTAPKSNGNVSTPEVGANNIQRYTDAGSIPLNARMESLSNTTGAELINSGGAASAAPVIVNNYGGSTTNNTTSSTNNTQSSYDPIISGSAMGFTSI